MDNFCVGKEVRVEKESTELTVPNSGTHILQVFPKLSFEDTQEYKLVPSI